MIPPGSTRRAIIEGGPEGLEIIIPAGRNLFAVVFLGVWLVGWLVGEVTAIAGLAGIASAGNTAVAPFLLVWLTFWTIGGYFAAYAWLWMLVGKERILMGASMLCVKRDILGLGRRRTYELFRIRDLRVVAQADMPRAPRIAFRPWGAAGGLIAFDYEGKTIRLGGAIEAAEARMIVERMKARFAFPEKPTVS
jgi:hypothetical protein